MTRHLSDPRVDESWRYYDAPCTCDLTWCAPCDEQRLFYLSGLTTAPTNGVDDRHPASGAGGPASSPVSRFPHSLAADGATPDRDLPTSHPRVPVGPFSERSSE